MIEFILVYQITVIGVCCKKGYITPPWRSHNIQVCGYPMYRELQGPLRSLYAYVKYLGPVANFILSISFWEKAKGRCGSIQDSTAKRISLPATYTAFEDDHVCPTQNTLFESAKLHLTPMALFGIGYGVSGNAIWSH